MRRNDIMLHPGFRSGAVALLLLAGACQDREPVDASPEGSAVVLNHVTLIDGTGAEPQPDSAVVIGGDGRVAWVGPASGVEIPNSAETIDLTGKYVMPGLIDLHVHIGNVVDLTQDVKNYTRENVEKDLKTLASYGVTTAAVMGTDQDIILPLVREQRSGRPVMTRVYTSGQGIVFRGGYGGIPNGNPLVSTPEEAAAAVGGQAAKGVDYIKFWVDDEQNTMPKMPREVSEAIIDAAHANGKKVYAHIFYLEDAKALVDQGIDGLVHSVRDQPVDQVLIDVMKARGVVQLAETLSREESLFTFAGATPIYEDPFFQRSLSPAALAVLRSAERQNTVRSLAYFDELPRFFQTAAENTRKLIDGGVTIGFGTDSGPPGRYLGYFAHWELQILVDDDGMTPLQAIRAATGQAAALLGNDEIGVVAPGKWADLMVLDADPAADIKNSRAIRAVYIAGSKVWQTAP